MPRFLRLEDVKTLTSLPTSTIYELMDRGDFPRPLKITPRRVAWLENEIAEWQRARIASARPMEAA